MWKLYEISTATAETIGAATPRTLVFWHMTWCTVSNERAASFFRARTVVTMLQHTSTSLSVSPSVAKSYKTAPLNFYERLRVRKINSTLRQSVMLYFSVLERLAVHTLVELTKIFYVSLLD